MGGVTSAILIGSVFGLASCSSTTLTRGEALWQAPRAGASKQFWKHWGDGKAELAGYRIVTDRYGQKREGQVVLIYVTEPLNRKTLIKDHQGSLPQSERLQVLKLNHTLKFTTGIYSYSVMTSVFAPVADYGVQRFAPAKVAFSAQEWCGHVYQQLKPGKGSLASSIRSYFSGEGDTDQVLQVPDGALYEDALLIQLRELDGPFNGGKNWSGSLVPSLWRARKAHVGLRVQPAKITVSDAARGQSPVRRFVLEFSGVKKTYDIDKAYPHRVLGWTESDGEEATLLKSVRLPYWKFNKLGDERYREQLGLN